MEKKSLDPLLRKLHILADAAKYDASCSSSGGKRKRDAKGGGMGNVNGMGICHSYAPDGRCISLLKILMTNYCIYDCKYCVNRVSSDTPRAKFTPEEIVDLTLNFYRRNYIEGLFLSSGIIKSSDDTMELLIQVAKTLRQKHRFNGYIHLKVVAGASTPLIEEAGRWADRVSANIEMPEQKDLDLLAPAKTLAEAEGTMKDIAIKSLEVKEDLKKNLRVPKFAPAGQTTQMIIGATPTTDSLILKRSELLYQNYSLRRVYYSAYSPIPYSDEILPKAQPSLNRENRLYQADWLIRFYGFNASEIIPADTNLALNMDPKTAWALRNRHLFPVDVNRAPKEMLLRIPGFGVRGVDKLLQLRRHKNVHFHDLKTLNLTLARAKFFVLTHDYNPHVHLLDRLNLEAHLTSNHQQMSLFEHAKEVVAGEV